MVLLIKTWNCIDPISPWGVIQEQCSKKSLDKVSEIEYAAYLAYITL